MAQLVPGAAICIRTGAARDRSWARRRAEGTVWARLTLLRCVQPGRVGEGAGGCVW